MPDLQPIINKIAEQGGVLLLVAVLFGLLAASFIMLLVRMLVTAMNRASDGLENSAKVEAFLQSAVEANTRATEANTAVVERLASMQQVHNQRLEDLINVYIPETRRRRRDV